MMAYINARIYRENQQSQRARNEGSGRPNLGGSPDIMNAHHRMSNRLKRR